MGKRTCDRPMATVLDNLESISSDVPIKVVSNKINCNATWCLLFITENVELSLWLLVVE